MIAGYRKVVKLGRAGKVGINFMFVSARQSKAMKGYESSPKSERCLAAAHQMVLVMGTALEAKIHTQKKKRCKNTHF